MENRKLPRFSLWADSSGFRLKKKSTYEPLSTQDIETSFSEGITHGSKFFCGGEQPATPQAAD